MITRTTIDYADAFKHLEVIVDHAIEHDYPIAVVVLNAFGGQLTSAVLPGAEPNCLNYAIQKATSALSYHDGSTISYRHEQDLDGTWHPAGNPSWSNLDAMIGLARDPLLNLWGGGAPIYHPSGSLEIVGAIGVSGLTGVQDHYLAEEVRPDKW